MDKGPLIFALLAVGFIVGANHFEKSKKPKGENPIIHRGKEPEGIAIANELAIRYDGIQKGEGNIPDAMQFTDIQQTGSTTYGNTLEEVRTNLKDMRAKFANPEVPAVGEVRNLKTITEMDTTPEITRLYPELNEILTRRGTAIDRMGDIQEKGGSGAKYQAIRDKADADLVTLQKKIATEHPELAYKVAPTPPTP